MILTTQNCISIMKVITSMGIKRELINLIKQSGVIENKKQEMFKAIKAKLGEEFSEEKVIGYLSKDKKLNEKYNTINEEFTTISFEMLFLIVEGIPKAENEFYKAIAEIKGTDINTEKGVDGADNVEFIKEILASETFKRFFTLLMK